VTAVLFDGVAFGLQLALLAVGLTMIFGFGGVLNLAHGQFAAATAILGARLIGGGLPVVPAVIVAVVMAGVLALVLDATLLRPVYRLHGEDRVLSSLLVTLGLAFAVDGLLIRFAPFTLLNLAVPGPALDVLGVAMRRGVVVRRCSRPWYCSS
jgi:branched-chain amino acid transport system permease protein